MRHTKLPIDNTFIERWSPRAFDPKHELTEIDMDTLFEAARWSPSCFNEQPWRFVYCLRQSADFKNFLDLLVEQNASWAKRASSLVFLFANKNFSKTGKSNMHAWFDCGSAWMSLTLQARKMGLHTHGMAGINRQAIEEYFGYDSNEYSIVCGLVVGKVTDPSILNNPDLEAKEERSGRKELPSIRWQHKAGFKQE